MNTKKAVQKIILNGFFSSTAKRGPKGNLFRFTIRFIRRRHTVRLRILNT